MTKTYNPKCNQSSGATFGDARMQSSEEISEREMKKRAEKRANEAAYQHALKAQRDAAKVANERAWQARKEAAERWQRLSGRDFV